MPLNDDDAAAVTAGFGVAPTQVERDHVISHVLAALSASDMSRKLIFFGGTALTRTFLPDLRLSEDIDLISTGSRSDAAKTIMSVVSAALARTHGAVSWLPPLDQTSDSQPATMLVGDDIRVRVQLLTETGYNFPTEMRAIEQRYSDAPPAALTTPTAEGSL